MSILKSVQAIDSTYGCLFHEHVCRELARKYSQIHLIEIWLIGISGSKQLKSASLPQSSIIIIVTS